MVQVGAEEAGAQRRLRQSVGHEFKMHGFGNGNHRRPLVALYDAMDGGAFSKPAK